MPATAYRIVTARLIIRCYEPSDATQLRDVVLANREHLAGLTWSRREPQTLDDKVALLRGLRADFDLDRDYSYGIFDGDGATLVGAVGMHPRVGAGAREIGYWVARDRAGQGLATEAAGALTRVGFELGGWQRLEIHCGPENRPSARVAEKLGYRHEATLRRRVTDGDGRPRDAMIWTLFADEYAASPAAQLSLQAFDAIGRRIL
jgi:RimJ/RimL family protein N-acetyltransferase